MVTIYHHETVIAKPDVPRMFQLPQHLPLEHGHVHPVEVATGQGEKGEDCEWLHLLLLLTKSIIEFTVK